MRECTGPVEKKLLLHLSHKCFEENVISKFLHRVTTLRRYKAF